MYVIFFICIYLYEQIWDGRFFGNLKFNELQQQSRIFNEAKNGNYSHLSTLLQMQMII